ncbi:VWA domain-containing protein [Streptomyces coeruleorubidus]|uniref:VWA domain-containing protein n=1 Tax=Streptomyces coeruleorubidus TaxID=116188 RepID=UPI003650F099
MGILTLLRNAFGRSRKSRTAEAEGAAQTTPTAETPSHDSPTPQSPTPAATEPKVPSPSPEPTPGPTADVPEPRGEHDLVSMIFDNVTVPRPARSAEEEPERTTAEKPGGEERAVAGKPAAEEEPTVAEKPAAEEEPTVTEKPAVEEERAAIEEPASVEEPVAEKPQVVEEPTAAEKPAAVAPEAEAAAEAKPEAEPKPTVDEPTAAEKPTEATAAEKPTPTDPAEEATVAEAQEPEESESSSEDKPTPEAETTSEAEPTPEAVDASAPAAADGDSAPQGPPAPDDESSTGGAGGNDTAEAEGEAEQTPTPAVPLTRVKTRAPSLTTAYKAATTTLKQRNLTGTRAKVYLVLDRSASMRPYYKDGSAQALAEQTLALAAHLDPEATVPVFFFSTELDGTGEITLTDHENKIDDLHAGLGRMGRTSYHAAVEAVLAHHGKEAAPGTPALVIFQTDGAPDAKTPATQSLTEAAKTHPAVFFSFVAFGDPENKAFDYLRKLKTPNTSHFLAGETPRELTDKELYEGVLANWRP